jgi:hypothetical protein
MRQAFRIGRAHFAGKFLDVRKHDLLVPHRDGAKLFLILVVLADGVDERAAVETFLAEPALQRRKDSRQFHLRPTAAGFDGADEPFAPLLAFALQHRVHQVGLGAEQFVERGLGRTGFVDDGVDAGRVDAVLAEQPCRRVEQAFARGIFIARGTTDRGRFLPRN